MSAEAHHGHTEHAEEPKAETEAHAPETPHIEPEVHKKDGEEITAKAPSAHEKTPKTEANAPGKTATGERPISRAVNSVRSGLSSSASQVVETTNKFGTWIRKVLRAGDLEPVEEKSLIQTPFYAAGHAIDGTALNAARRGVEVIEPTISGIRAMWRSTIGTILHPIDTLRHPVKALKNPARLFTSQLMTAKNILMAPLRSTHEFADRTVNRTVEQIAAKIEKIPLIGPLLAKPSTFITGIIAKTTAAVKNTLDWLTSPVDHMHNAVAPA